MEEREIDALLGKVNDLEHVSSSYVCSRAGNFISGTMPKFADRNMYSAITSLTFGTAEQVGNEMNDDLKYVSLRFTNANLLVVGLGPRHLLGMIVDGLVDPETIVSQVRPLIK